MYMLRFSLLIVSLLLLSDHVVAQTRYTLNGYVKDSLSGETIIGATVAVNGQSRGVTSNQYGFYSLTLDEGKYEIQVSHVSYMGRVVPVNLNADQTLNFDLLSKSALINEVVLYSKKRDGNVKNAQMGKIDLTMNQVRAIPAFMGKWIF